MTDLPDLKQAQVNDQSTLTKAKEDKKESKPQDETRKGLNQKEVAHN